MKIVLFLQPVNQPLTKDVNVAWLDKTNFLLQKMDLVKYVQDKYITKKEFPEFKAGDTITVYYEIKEGAKTRTQFFKGTVIQLRGTGLTKTFTIRKMSGDVGVERAFPLNMPALQKIELDRRGKVKRARIYYFRNLRGKKARIKDAAYKK